MWISATEGDENQMLETLAHWPETEFAKNDFYTGQRLDNWTKPYKSLRKDTFFGDTANCMYSYNWNNQPWNMSWREWYCESYEMSCPCSYSDAAQPLLRLRDKCKNSVIRDVYFSPKQLSDNPGNMILLGDRTTRVEYNPVKSLLLLVLQLELGPLPSCSHIGQGS